MAELLRMRGIRKAFDGVEVLRGVDFAVQAGEVHALVGENGAGKSTLIKVLAGVHTDYRGEIVLNGRPVRFRDPREAAGSSIAVIHQELSLVPYLSVAENIALGREPRTRLGGLDRRRMRATTRGLVEGRLGLALDVDRRVGDLPIALQQMVEIAKALAHDARVLVMDEPTSALGERDAARLFEAVRQLRADGVGIVYISHRMEEIYALADRITVLRDGLHVGTAPPAELPLEQLVHWMVGRSIEQFFPRHSGRPGAELLAAEDIWVRAASGGWAVRGASLRVRAGEVVGLAGLVGCGHSELLGAIYGRGGLARGTVTVAGTPLDRPAPGRSLARGVALLTNDRKASGLVLPMSVLQNASLATLEHTMRGGLLSGRRERRRALPLFERLKVRARSAAMPVATLSGGNQQKVLLARWLLAEPRVLLLDEPTRGIDVSAKADIYALLNELTAAGLGIVLISGELPELLNLADRIVVMHRGTVAATLGRDEATQERIMRAALGTA